MDDWLQLDDEYQRRTTRNLRLGDVVVWGVRHDRRPKVVAVARTGWRRYAVALSEDGQTAIVGGLRPGTVWYVLA